MKKSIKKLDVNKLQASQGILREGEEKYIKFLSKSKVTTLPSRTIYKKAFRKALLIGGSTGLAIALSPIIGAAGISALWGIKDYVVIPALLFSMLTIPVGLLFFWGK